MISPGCNYTTHIRGKGCTLITDSEHCSISASGQGMKLWREIVFTRMAIHLYKQFTKDIDSQISMSSPQNFNMTSNPSTSMTTKAVLSPNITPVTVKPNETGIQQKIVNNKLSLSELNSHEAELTEISKSLQYQLSLVNSKIDALLERSGPNCPESKYDTFITLSETNANDDSNLIPGGSSYSDNAVNNAVKFTSNSDKEGKQETINSTDIVESISPGTPSYIEALINGEPANTQKQSDPSGRKTISKQSK